MKWYQKKLVIVLLLVIFFPAGIYLMWKYTDWSKGLKAVLTVIAVIFSIGVIFSQGSDLDTTADTTTNGITAVSTTKPAATALATITTTAAPVTNKQTTAPVTTSPITTTSTIAESPSIQLISLTSPISQNETATIAIKGAPNTSYNINVVYNSGSSKAAGLENKTSDSSGNVSWSWKIGGTTDPGAYNITINGGDATYKTTFVVQ